MFCTALVWLFGAASPFSQAGAASPAADATAAIDQRLAGKVPDPGHWNLLATANWETGADFSWNKGVWCADWLPYLSCFSPWNSNEHGYQGGTLITPKHVLFAEHFSGASGSNTLHPKDKLVFIGKSGVSYTRALLRTPSKIGSSDLCLGTLDRDLPPDVIPAQVLPPGLPPSFLPPGTPVIFTNKNKEVHVAEVAAFGQQAIMPAKNPARVPWTLSGPAFVGDSGSPVFIILNGRPVLWWLFHFPNAGEPITAYVPVIDEMLGRGYKLDVATVPGI